LVTIRLGLAYGIGFLLPGYAVSRLLRSPSPLASALPLSWLSLSLGAWLLQVSGAGVGFASLLAWQALVALAAGWAWWKGPRRAERTVRAVPPRPRGPAQDRPGWALLAPLAGSTLLVGLLMLIRSTADPLTGWDTLWRWDFLARRLVELGHLDFYPPVSAADFRIYFYPDGFPPIVSVAYAFLYAAAGAHLPWILGPLVFLQWASTVALTWHAGQRLLGSAGAWIACALLAATPLFFRSVAIGQETGLTAMAMAGTLCFLLPPGAEEGPDRCRRELVLAGALAALGATAREYGFFLVAVGLVVLVWHRRPWREAGLFAAIALASAAPWYLRNWLRAGNPLYIVEIGPFHSASPVLSGILEVYGEHLGIFAFGARYWLAVGRMLAGEMPVALLGLLAGIGCFRRLGFLLLALLFATAAWLYSLGFTSGGAFYASRMLGSSVVPAALLAAAALRPLAARRRGAVLVVAVAIGALLFRLPYLASFPFLLGWSEWIADPAVTLRSPGERAISADFVAFVRKEVPPGSRMLSDDAYAHAVLFGSGVEVVPLWSPEVAFLFDPALAPAHARDRLRVAGIEWLLLERPEAAGPGSLNAVFLSRFSFFRDTEAWQKVPAPVPLYRLPSPP
jgi:hypothetical protein